MLEQTSVAVAFAAHFTESKLGKTGLTVTVDVYNPSGSKVVTAAAATEVGDGIYSYTLAGASTTSAGVYIAIFKTTTTTVDQREIVASWVLQSDFYVYEARVWLADDDANTNDRYIVQWYKNGQPVTSGITSPTIQVVQTSDAADLIAETAMSAIGSTGALKYDEATNRITAGAGYLIITKATIDGAARDHRQPMSRDSTA